MENVLNCNYDTKDREYNVMFGFKAGKQEKEQQGKIFIDQQEVLESLVKKVDMLSDSMEENKKETGGIGKQIVIQIVSGVAVALLSVGGSYIITESVNKSNIENLAKRMDAIDVSIKNLISDVSRHEGMLISMDAVDSGSGTTKLKLKSGMQIQSNIWEVGNPLAALEWEGPASFIAKNYYISDKQYTAEELYNKKVLIPYNEGDNEVYFYGQFNENGQWNGQCILNVYKDNNLLYILDAIYNDGDLYSYRRVSGEEDGTWIVTNRTKQKDHNEGETFYYTKSKDFTKTFTFDSVNESEILDINSFKKCLVIEKERLIKYYNGNTSEELYNDDTGNAYLVKYKDDGKVDSLYVGKLKKGQPHDDTGNAWSIRAYDDGYHYYKGKFRSSTPKNWKPLVQEEINQIVDPNKFACSLEGLIDKTE